MQPQKVIVIVGPTASGKSALAVRMAKKRKGEVISADSRQVYKGLDIGSGKITKKEMRGVPHHMLDVASPKKVFTAHDFAKKGKKILDDILARGKTPIVCGGTGFYIDALLGRISLPEVPANPKLRAELEKKTAPQLFTQLQKLDPERAETIDQHNPVRLVRAIEIATALGSVPKLSRCHLDNLVEWIGIDPGDEILKKKIHKRLLSRMKSGMLREARRLHKNGLSYKRMEELGLEYRHMGLFLQKKISLAQMLIDIESDSMQYVKRQRTYWRRNKEIKWN